LAQFNGPKGICVDAAGIVYVADRNNSKIKKIWSSGKVTSLAGGTGGGFANGNGSTALFSGPYGICINKSRKLFVADTGNFRIRQVDEAGNVVTLAGFATGYVDGVGNAARFAESYAICVDNSGVIYVLDFTNEVIRKVLDNGNVTTLMGWKSGTVSLASCIAVDNSGFLYILEKNI
jgi:sugar lactone lactonase YvrE